MCERGEEKPRPPGLTPDAPSGFKENSSQLELERVDSAYGSSSITESLLDSCPRGQEEQHLEALTYLSEDGDTFLHLAIIHGCPEIAVDFISLVTTEVLEIQNDSCQSPLHLAVYLDQAEVVQALVRKGVNLELQDQNGNTPLHIACQWDHLHCAQILLQEDEPVSSSQIRQNLQLQNWKGLACLHIATLKQNYSLISLLLRRGADINVQEGTGGKTPLHLAVETQNCSVVSYLLRMGALVDAPMFNACTPLHLAVGRKDASMASLLCHSGADTLLRNMEDETAQDLANGNDDILALLPFDDLKISGQPVVWSEQCRKNLCNPKRGKKD
ncbi:NF-kappa-B inhibitor epsilon [Microcaecilia unicolor]|uniref:NF-kappa-B inhibitor epsilon n=1 Tax=Microcaecilia unicolor TaxID=1415580 RepID=A0A6P7X7S8_9AMPH|nr:NF-kappa-B inhibitor epsilon [Microcaecilia unicolor]